MGELERLPPGNGGDRRRSRMQLSHHSQCPVALVVGLELAVWVGTPFHEGEHGDGERRSHPSQHRRERGAHEVEAGLAAQGGGDGERPLELVEVPPVDGDESLGADGVGGDPVMAAKANCGVLELNGVELPVLAKGLGYVPVVYIGRPGIQALAALAALPARFFSCL